MTVAMYDDSDPIQEMMDKVASRIMEGKSELAIARDLGIKRVEVINYHNMWKDRVNQDMEMRDAAKDHLNQMIKHYDKLIGKFYELVTEIDFLSSTHQTVAQKANAYKNIADLEAKRVDLLQKAGLLEGAELGDELAEMEEKQKILIDILRNDLCPDCQKTVARRLQQVTNVVEAVVIHDTDDDNNE